MKKYILIPHIIYLLLIHHHLSFAQIPTRHIESTNIQDYVENHSNHKAAKEVVKPTNLTKLIEEDEVNKSLPPRFGIHIKVDFDLNNSGLWEETSNGRIWKLEIQSSGAFSLNLMFDDFHLSKGSELYVYNGEQTMLYGPVTSDHNNDSKKFATNIIKGNSIILELYEPMNARGESNLHINSVVHGYKNMFTSPGFGLSAPCNIDINCEQGDPWQDESDAVAMVIVNGNRSCTGTLLNNACQDFTPSFLTAFHCLDNNGNGVLSQQERDAVQNWVFVFQYKSPVCNGGNATLSNSITGADFRSAWVNSDFALMELDQRPQANSGIQYSGWSSVVIL